MIFGGYYGIAPYFCMNKVLHRVQEIIDNLNLKKITKPKNIHQMISFLFPFLFSKLKKWMANN